MFDTVIRHGLLIDGSGTPGSIADLGINQGKIAAIGQNLGPGLRELDAAGYCVTPGFLDIHRHGDAAAFRKDYGKAELRQGLTTVLNGACGVSLVPFGETHREELIRYLSPITGTPQDTIPTGSLAEYQEALKQVALPLNVGMMVGGGTIRADLFGYGEKLPEDISPIHRKLEQAMAEGAYGISLGLGYAPECFYTTQELIRVLEPLRNGKIPITVHMRHEGDQVCDSVAEMIQVAKALNCPMHISHLKAMGMRNWKKKIPQALELMKRAREEGVDISCDCYLYDAGSTQLLHLLPPDFLVGGVEAICQRLNREDQRQLLRQAIAQRRDFDNIAQMVGWKNIMISGLNLPKYQHLIGKTLEEAARLLHLEPVDCLCQLLSEERCAVTMIDRMICEEDIFTILHDPYSSVISDATYPDAGLPHPRVYGNVTRLFERFVLEKKVLSLEQAVHKVTELPAQAMGIARKGRLQVGFDADIDIFKPQELHETAAYLSPRQESQGMDTVLVNGEPAILHGQWQDLSQGKVLVRE